MPHTTISSMAIVNHPAVTNPMFPPAMSTPKRGTEVYGSQEKIAFGVFLNEIDEHLKRCPDRTRPGARPYDFLALLPARDEH